MLGTLFFVAAVVTTGAEWWPRRQGRSAAAGDVSAILARLVTPLAVGAAVFGVLAAVWAIRTGHEGARVTWSGVDVGGG